jgi:hypothetical protein
VEMASEVAQTRRKKEAWKERTKKLLCNFEQANFQVAIEEQAAVTILSLALSVRHSVESELIFTFPLCVFVCSCNR